MLLLKEMPSLSSELDEKESLKMAVQRLKDETRDLRSELKVQPHRLKRNLITTRMLVW